MLHFQYSTLINAPVEKIWTFYERHDILEMLTPPWQPVKVVRREGGLEVGAISEFLIILGIFPIRWVAQHTDCIKNRLFVDEQVEGPLQSWVHRHEFIAENGKTRLMDSIDFELPGGFLAEWILAGWVKARLRDMFQYRHKVTQQRCELDRL